MPQNIEVAGWVVEGTKAASGICHFTEHGGTIALQRPHFVRAGVNMTEIHNGTINVDISPLQFTILRPEVVVSGVSWHPTVRDKPETFWFVACTLLNQGNEYLGLVYFPHPDTKIGNFPGFSVLEILAPFILGLSYGQQVTLRLPGDRLKIGQ